jgi:Bardet-Biedl syndrome 4 protein
MTLFLVQDYVKCLQVIEEQLQVTNGLSEYPLYVKALILRQQGRIDESLTTFQAALCLNPSNINNLKQVGQSLYLLGKHKNALDVFGEAEKLAPDDRDTLHNKGMCYLYLKQYAQAIENFETANSIQRHELTYMQLGRVQRLLGKDEDALNTYLDALELAAENPELLTTIGLLFLKIGNNTKAFEYLGNSLTYDPKNPKSILAAGSIIQDNQDMDVALSKYRVAVLQTPNSAPLWNNIGMCFFGKGKYVAAASCLKRAVYLSPFEFIINFNLGIIHLTTEQYASAFHYFSTSINLNPSYARSYMYLAVALSRLDDFENSCAAYEKALELGQDYLIHLNYAISLYLNDEVESSREHYKAFESLFSSVGSASADIDHDILQQASVLKQLLSGKR